MLPRDAPDTRGREHHDLGPHLAVTGDRVEIIQTSDVAVLERDAGVAEQDLAAVVLRERPRVHRAVRRVAEKVEILREIVARARFGLERVAIVRGCAFVLILETERPVLFGLLDLAPAD